MLFRTLLIAGVVGLAVPSTLWAQPGKKDKDADAKAKDAEEKADEAGGLYDCPQKVRRGRYVVSLKPETELDDLIKWAMTFHCKNFVYSSEIGKRSAKVTIMTPEKMTASQAWRVFLVALQSMNLTVVPKGNVMEIIEQPKAKQMPLPIYTEGDAPQTDQVVRVVLRPQYLSVDDLGQVLGELKSKDGTVKILSNAGMVVVTDFGSNVNKMANLMLVVDQPVAGERLYMIRVNNADASELAAKLTELLGERAGAGGDDSKSSKSRSKKRKKGDDDVSSIGGVENVASAIPSKIIPDERTNSLVVMGSEAAYLRVKALVARLDVGIDVEGAGRIHVYLLENADAEEMANTLTTVISGIQQASGNQDQNQRNQRNRRAQAPAAALSDSAAAFEGEVRVTHDKPTNSLVIVASVKDFLALRDVVQKLDTPRPQVYIEATIVEVAVDNSIQYGTSFHGGADVGDGSLVLGGVQHADLSSLNIATLATSTGLLGGALGPLLPNAEQLLGQSIPSFGVLFQALATNSNVNVLSSPHILTTDNQEAEISVGENIPYQSALVGGVGAGQTGNFFAPTQSIQRQDVALTLKITPHINASSMVRLEIDLEISDIASQDFQGLGPSWAKRTIKDTVVVRDQQSVVIGGLMSDKDISSRSKIPILGDIPVIGQLLFSYNQKRKEKRNLLVLLTPNIVHEQMDIEQIVERRTREQREFIRTFSTFEAFDYRPEIDYRRKRGVLEEINRVIGQNEHDAAILQELERKMIEIPDGAIEYDGAAPGEEDGEEAEDADGDTTSTAEPASDPVAEGGE